MWEYWKNQPVSEKVEWLKLFAAAIVLGAFLTFIALTAK